MTDGWKPLMFKGQHDMAAFLAQSPDPIYRRVFPWPKTRPAPLWRHFFHTDPV